MLDYIVISIHALRKESDADAGDVETRLDISIHALRKESDVVQEARPLIRRISIHALRKESDGSGRYRRVFY